jgi:hypothetical protein
VNADALFDAAPYYVPVAAEPPGAKVSDTRKRTARQLRRLAKGTHPIAGLPLHQDAAPHDDQQAPGLRCRDCRFHQLMGGHSRAYPKCYWPDPNRYKLAELPRVTMGGATDCRGWYPACTDFEPREDHR